MNLLKNNYVRFFVAAWAFVSISSFALECERLLHSNLRSIKYDIEATLKKSVPDEDRNGGVEIFSAHSDEKFYASTRKSFGYVETKTGKFTPIVAADANSSLSMREAGPDYILGTLYRKRSDPSITDPEDVGFTTARERLESDRKPFVVERASGKVVYLPKQPKSAVIQADWRGQSPFIVHANRGRATAFNIKTGTSTTIDLPFHPTAFTSFDDYLVITAPNQAPALFHLPTGDRIRVPGLSAYKFGSSSNPAEIYRIVPFGKKVSFRALLPPEIELTKKPRREFTIDAEKRTVKTEKPWIESYYSYQTYGDGSLESRISPNVFMPEATDGNSLKNRKPNQILIDLNTGEPVVPPSEWISVFEGKNQVLIRRFDPIPESETSETTVSLYNTNTREIQDIKIPKGFGFSTAAYDSQQKTG
jgi:hypothetical protein